MTRRPRGFIVWPIALLVVLLGVWRLALARPSPTAQARWCLRRVEERRLLAWATARSAASWPPILVDHAGTCTLSGSLPRKAGRTVLSGASLPYRGAPTPGTVRVEFFLDPDRPYPTEAATFRGVPLHDAASSPDALPTAAVARAAVARANLERLRRSRPKLADLLPLLPGASPSRSHVDRAAFELKTLLGVGVRPARRTPEAGCSPSRTEKKP